MSTAPHVRLHLVREIMNMIRLRSNGDTLMHLALAGRGHLGILQYIAETHFTAVVALGEIHVAVGRVYNYNPSTFVKNKALRCVVRRYLKTLLTGRQQLDPNIINVSFIPDKIVKVMLGTVDVPLLNSLPNIEALVVKDHKEFFQYVKTENVHLKSLSCLTLKLGLWDSIRDDGILGLLPLPQDNMLRLVKHLQVDVKLVELTLIEEILEYFSTLLHYFPSVETSSLLVDYCDNARAPHLNFNHSTKFIDWLGKLEVNSNLTTTFHDKHQCMNAMHRAIFKKKLEAAGFAETDNGKTFVMVKTFPSAKFIYSVDLVLFGCK